MHGLLEFKDASMRESHLFVARLPTYVKGVSATCGKRFVDLSRLVNSLTGAEYFTDVTLDIVNRIPESNQATAADPGANGV
jgi:hypothetical protein